MNVKLPKFVIRMSKAMIYAFVICYSVTMVVASTSIGQRKLLREIEINLAEGQDDLIDLIQIIEKTEQFGFSYTKRDIKSRKIDIRSGTWKMDALLSQLSVQAGVSFKRINEDITVKVVKKEGAFPLVDEEVSLQATVSGTITDENGEPLPGATIQEKGTTNGTITDFEGSYSLSVPEDATLTVSFVGYETKQIPLNGRATIDVSLAPDVSALEEVVVVGYGAQEKKSLTGSVNSVNADELKEVKVPNATQLLQGRVPGVITKQSSGLPGQDNANLSIRGFGNPLVLVDNMERDLSTVDPNEIESISVLKDASAAIFGARSGNGVILITTKRGSVGKPKLSYDGSYSVQQFTKKPAVITDAGRYAEFWTEAEENMGVNTTYTPEEIQNYKDGIPGYESYDWYDFAIKKWTPMQQHNLSVNGGSDAITYFAGLGYTDQGSVIKSDDFFYKRYNVRSNVNAKISENFSASLDFDYTHEFQRLVPQEDGNNVNTMMRGIYKSQPMAPTSFPDTTLIPTSNLQGTHNRLYGNMFADIGGFLDSERNIITTNFSLDYKIPGIDGLSTNFRLIYRVNELRVDQFRKAFALHQRDPDSGTYTQIGVFGANNKNLLNIRDRRFTRIKPIYQIEYKKELADHSINGLFIAQYIGEKTDQITAQTENLLSDELPYLNFGDPIFNRLGQFVTENGRTSFAGRLKYGYKDKYLIEGTLRFDASSFFPPETRWGTFPSVSVGWVLSEESFLQSSGLINFLKMRASYSRTGYDQNAIPYDYFTGYSVVTNPPFLFGSDQYRRLTSSSLPNTDMTWENMTIYNVGFDATILNGALLFQADAFYRKRSNVLATPISAFPSTFGAALPLENLNSSEDRGIEFMVTHRGNAGDFKYSVSGNFTFARSEWIHFEEENYDTESEIRVYKRSGTNMNRSVGYVSDGLFRSQAEIDNHPIDQDQNGNATLIPGDIKYVDINNDGVITWEDQQEIGRGTGDPDLNFGFNFMGGYKNFNLSILLQGGSMYAGNVSGLARLPFNNASTPFELHWENRFHPEKNPEGTLPIVTLGVRDNNNRFSDFWLRDITYLRIENVRLTYTIPDFIQNIGIDRFQIYVSGNNLHAFSNLGIYKRSFDPEAGLTHNDYPPNRTWTIGVNVNF